MNFMTTLALLTLPMSVSATTLLECQPREGKFEVQQQVIGHILIQSKTVTLFQELPVFETVNFKTSTAIQGTTRTGSWMTYEMERELDNQIITLQIEDGENNRPAVLL